MDVGIRMRILIWVGVLNHAAERLRFQHDPRAFSFLKVVSDLHAGAGRPTRLWSKLNFRMSLVPRSEEHTSELQSHSDLVCRLLLEKKKRTHDNTVIATYDVVSSVS